MDVKKQPYFFSDQKFKADVVIWKELLDKSFKAAEKLDGDKIAGKILNEDKSEVLIAYYSAVLDAYNSFSRMANTICEKTILDQTLLAEYSSFTMPTDKVIQCQIFQYILPELSMEELFRLVEMQNETVNSVVESVKKMEKQEEL
ncbi:hypothetical protein FW778_07720 [Ginsengibacter hankyongi]|uniref:Uncharacterized protein n=1 Tax=Ginsengibacter hankyongi TaxID=2607284 RepID=A0A5J5IPI3_9BACT|nr:hypothetical protein [Ginsengibacter hankyongi]KAA9041894.1 hypothetical protein FW778_07720 [Ginsengibacter hankyongi]